MPRNDLPLSGENAGDWQLVVSLIVKVCKDADLGVRVECSNAKGTAPHTELA